MTLFGTQPVTFTHPDNPDDSFTAWVFITRAGQDAFRFPQSTRYRWAITFPQGLTFESDNSPVQDGTLITAEPSILPHGLHQAPLQSVMPLGPPIPRVRAYFDEVET